MNPQTPKALKRVSAVTLATALAGAAILPGIAASAADTVVVLPSKIVIADKPGWSNDTYTLPAVTGVKWTVKVGSAAADAPVASAAAAKPFSAAPADAKTAVVVTAAADTGYALPANAKAFTLNFNTSKVKTTVPAPTLVVDKATKLVTGVSVPYAAGVSYKVGSTAIDTATTKKAVVSKLTNETTVAVTATLGGDYMVDPKAVLTTTWNLTTKTTATAATAVAASKQDNPGKGDFVVLTGVTGVVHTVNGKKVNVKPNTTVKVSTAGKTSVVVGYDPEPGYTVALADTTLSFSTATDQAVTVAKAADSYALTITANPNIKSWKFAGKAIVVPQGTTTMVVTLPSDGELTVEPVAGYTLTQGSLTANSKGAITIPVTKAAALS